MERIGKPRRGGWVFNLAGARWEEIARIIFELNRSSAPFRVVPKAEWTGTVYLGGRWELDDFRIRAELGFKPTRDPAGVREAL
jgi:hypothetical protein